MQVSNIDKNFILKSDSENEIVFYDVLNTPFSLHGINYDSDNGWYVRMPLDVACTVSEGVHYLARHTSGGRVRFSTNSKNITIKVEYDLETLPYMTLLGSSGFSLCKCVNNKEIFVNAFMPNFDCKNGYTASVSVNSLVNQNYTLYFPLYNNVKRLFIGLEKGAYLGSGIKYRDIKPILYYGSSITQGGCANRPDNSYEAQIVKNNNVDYICLGFSGSAKSESNMIDYLKGIDCSVFVFDYDHNAPDVKYLSDTHYNAYLNYRNSNPNTPIILISKPDYLKTDDGFERLKVIKRTYALAKKSGDKNVYFIDGSKFFGKDYHLCLVDGCHPTDLGFYKMAKKIGKLINSLLNV